MVGLAIQIAADLGAQL